MPTHLANLRKQAHITAQALARMAGASLSSINMIERGISQRPNPLTIRKIVAVLNVEPGEILEFVDRYRLPPQHDGPTPLRELRQRAYLAITDLAALSEVSYSIITAIEIHIYSASPAQMHRIANALGVRPGDISEFVPRPDEPQG